MALYRDEGVILRTSKLGEADRIVTVLTKNHGKVRAVAKGVRRTKSRFGARLEPFMRNDLLIAQGRSLDIISQASSLGTYAAEISENYDAYAAASAMVETVDRVVSSEHEPAGEQYWLIVAALAALSKHRHSPDSIGDSFVMRSLALAGWAPRLDSCVVCARRNQLDYISVQSGGAMCTIDRTPDARRVSVECRQHIKALVQGDWLVLDQVGPDASTRQMVQDWGEYYLERPIRSLHLMDC